MSARVDGKFRLVLASRSPRRIDLLTNLGLRFEIVESRSDESYPPGMKPAEVVKHVAHDKAQEVFERLAKQCSTSEIGKNPLVVIGADTMVVLDGQLLGKPSSKEEAVSMLKRLSGRSHIVFTGVTVLVSQVDAGKVSRLEFETVEQSNVYFRELAEKEIRAYVETGEPMDKAGAYALQGIGACLVEKIDGCSSNIIGLPIPKTVELLRQAGLNILGMPDDEDAEKRS